MKEFFKKLKELRVSSKFTQQQMADKLGISLTQYQKYEVKMVPPHEKILKLNSILNFDFSRIIYHEKVGNDEYIDQLEEPEEPYIAKRRILKNQSFHNLTPVFNTTASAGRALLFNDHPEIIAEYVDIPFIGKSDGVIEIVGSSMSPTYLNGTRIAVRNISRKHIKRILNNCSEVKKTWNADRFNAYRRDLTMLFVQLLELEAVDSNPVRDIAKQKTVRKIKSILTPNECRKIDEFIKKYDRRFWLLINIFFHSGARTTEMFRVRMQHVNLKQQMVLYTVLKGNQPFEVLRPIKNIALPFWKEACEGARPGDYIFSKGLAPGPEPISQRQATMRWHRHIKGDKDKGKLGITCSWYSLKYLNTDQVDEQKGLRIAAKLNSHKNTATTKLYAVNSDAREMEEIKEMDNAFAG